jgi:HlyD family secretion protein
VKAFIKPILFSAYALAVLTSCRWPGRQDDKRFSGTLEVTEHAVGARVAGRITEIHFEESAAVTQGQLLATLDRYAQAQKDHARAARLLKTGGATEQSVEQAALAVEDQKIVSPVNGVVIIQVRELGEVVAAGNPVAVIGDTGEFWVRIFVPEGQVNKLKIGQAAQVFFDGVAQPLIARVSAIAPRAEFTPRNVQTEEERITQTFAVKVALTQKADFLRPGVAADVVIEGL